MLPIYHKAITPADLTYTLNPKLSGYSQLVKREANHYYWGSKEGYATLAELDALDFNHSTVLTTGSSGVYTDLGIPISWCIPSPHQEIRDSYWDLSECSDEFLVSVAGYPLEEINKLLHTATDHSYKLQPLSLNDHLYFKKQRISL